MREINHRIGTLWFDNECEREKRALRKELKKYKQRKISKDQYGMKENSYKKFHKHSRKR